MLIDNNAVKSLNRALTIDRKNWLFISLGRAKRCGATILSLIHSTRLNGHDTQVYLNDVLERLPMYKAKDIDEFLPNCWQVASAKQLHRKHNGVTITSILR